MGIWKRVFKRDRLSDELREELDAHMALAKADAAANPERDFGNRLLIEETVRDAWGWCAVERFFMDLRYALRQLRRAPGFTAVAVLTLALGLGGAIAMFSVVNGVLLDPMKYREPGDLYIVRGLPPAGLKFEGDIPVNARHFHEWRTRCQSCESMGLFHFGDMVLTGAGESTRLPSFEITHDFFPTLGVTPALGRNFTKDEELPNQWAEVILTDTLWRERFHADPSIYGRKIQLNGELFTVVGVMPADFRLPKGEQWGQYVGPAEEPLIFRPLGDDVSRAPPAGNNNYSCVLRVKRGISGTRASDELNALSTPLFPTVQQRTPFILRPMRDYVTRNASQALWLLLGAVGAVLLIVCLNIGNLMLARASGRYREAGVRLALGASRGRVFRQILHEALLLVIAGSSLGLLFAQVAIRAFVAAAPVELPRATDVGIDVRVALFALAAAAVSTIVCGIVPAWRLASAEPHDALRSGGANSTDTQGRLKSREVLVCAEVALSTILLLAGALLVASFQRVLNSDKGIEVAHVVTQEVSLKNPKYKLEARRAFLESMLAKLAQVPGVTRAGTTSLLPLVGEDWIEPLYESGKPEPRNEGAALTNVRFVSPGYMEAMGVVLKKGRFIEPRDADRPVAVISEAAARHLWPNENPLGKLVQGMGYGSNKPGLEVLGVVGEVRADGLEKAAPITIYQGYWSLLPPYAIFALRTQGDPSAAASAMQTILRQTDPELALAPAQTMEQIVDKAVANRRFQMMLIAAFAVAALALASLGIYGVIAYNVSRRTPEFGVRTALGAGTGELVAMVVRQGMTPVALGLALGLAGSLALGGVLASQLYGIGPRDPITIAAVAALLATVATLACVMPARRAARIDPLRALRFE